MPEAAVVPRPGAAPIIGAGLGVGNGGAGPTPAIEPARPAIREQFPVEHRLPARGLEAPPREPLKWGELDRETMPLDMRDVYDTIAAERKALEEQRGGLSKAWETEKKDLTDRLETTNREYRGLIRALMQSGMLTEDGQLVSPAPTGYRPVNGEVRRETTTAQPGPDELPNIDWYDPQALFRAMRAEMLKRDQAWTQYATELNKWWMDNLVRGQGYSIAAARLLATDPEFAKDPKLVQRLFTEAPQYRGDIEAAYKAIKEPLAERSALEKQLTDLKAEVERYKKQTPGLLGMLAPSTPRPIKPIVGSRPGSWGSTGRYQQILSRYDPAAFITQEEETPPEQVAAF